MSLEKIVNKSDLAVWSLQGLLALIRYLNGRVFWVISPLKPFISCVIRNTPVCNDGSLQKGQSVTSTSLTQDTNACLITGVLLSDYCSPSPPTPPISWSLSSCILLKEGFKKKKENPIDSHIRLYSQPRQSASGLVTHSFCFPHLNLRITCRQLQNRKEVFQGAQGGRSQLRQKFQHKSLIGFDSHCHWTVPNLLVMIFTVRNFRYNYCLL